MQTRLVAATSAVCAALAFALLALRSSGAQNGTDEARRLTLLLGDPAIENKSPLVVSLQAIGEFHQYLRMRRGYANQMRYELEQIAEAGLETDVDGAAE